MNKICVVGGGTAGLISALILKSRFSNIQVDVIKSDKIGIIGVGEGSTEHWDEFIKFCDISVEELITETDATFKHGLLFENWTKKPYYHNVIEEFCFYKVGQYLGAYAHCLINDKDQTNYTANFSLKNLVNKRCLPLQFHFNARKLQQFLLKKCVEKNINIITDEIENVIVKNNNISYIKSKNKKYDYDFFIDSTGYKKLLISKLGAKWISHKDCLPLNHAIAFETPDTDEYNSYTLTTAMKYGWMWRAPTYGRWGNGYVFDDTYINAEQAQKECEELLGHKIKVGRDIKFQAGALDKVWIGNCVAVGLSANFLEPLEATSIGSTIQQNFLLMHLLINATEKDKQFYNSKINDIVENMRDFVVLHYLVDKKDSDFWKNIKKRIKVPKSLKDNLKKWKNRLPIKEDFKGDYLLFYESNFVTLLIALGLIDIKKIKKEYNLLNNRIKSHIELYLNKYYSDIKDIEITGESHKNLLTKIRKGEFKLL